MPSTWMREWNDIIRYVIWKDETLLELMKIPANTTILSFMDKYFIRGKTVGTPLKDEAVRIVYGTYGTSLGDNAKVLINEMSFDIYVKEKELHNVGNDRLMFRTELIAERLNTLLTDQYDTRLGGYRFRCVGQSDMSTSTIGYVRYNITFQYKKTV